MLPSFWSKAGFTEMSLGWHQYGDNLVYEQSMYTKDINDLNPKSARNYMSLSFTYNFAALNDEVYCAQTIPYTFSALKSHIKQLKLLQ